MSFKFNFNQGGKSTIFHYYMSYLYFCYYFAGKIELGKRTLARFYKYVICGYEYVGEELSEDIICLICKHSASGFEKVVVEANA